MKSGDAFSGHAERPVSEAFIVIPKERATEQVL